jgi:hypothetical protein
VLAPGKSPTTRPVAVWIAVAAVAAGTAGAIYLAQGPERVATVPTSPADRVAAVELRQRAADACNAGKGAECLLLLDQAREKDPAGDTAPEVKLLRETAKRAIEATPAPTPAPSPSAFPPTGPKPGPK